MGYEIQISDAPGDENLPDAKLQNLIALLRPRMSIATIPGSSGETLLFQSAVPNTSDQDKLWFRKSSDAANGVIVGVYFFCNGKWCKAYSVPIGTMVMWMGGDPTQLFNLNTGKGNFDSSIPNVAADWYGWQFVLESGTSNFPGRFLLPANKWDGGSSSFQAKLPDGSYSGQGDAPTGQELTVEMIPSLPVDLRGYELGTASNGPGRNIISTKWTGDPQTAATGETYQARWLNPNTNEVPDKVPTQLPAFKAVGMLVFIGYGYTDPSA